MKLYQLKWLKLPTLILGLLVFSFGCATDSNKTQSDNPVSPNSEIKVYDFDAIEPLLYTNEDKTYIINFWAMWCAPCVKEMPYLQEFAENNPDIELIFVSMDFPKEIETTLKPFLKDKNITSRVVLLDDPNSNYWIDKIDPNWSGAIPFTIVFNNKKRQFFERSFDSLEDFETVINNFSEQ